MTVHNDEDLMTDWLIAWIDRSTFVLIDWLTDWLIDWFDWLTDWRIDWIYWLTEFTDWVIDLCIDWLIDYWQIDLLTGWPFIMTIRLNEKSQMEKVSFEG